MFAAHKEHKGEREREREREIERLRFNFGPIGVNNVLGEQKGEKLIWAGEPKKASVIKKKISIGRWRISQKLVIGEEDC